MESIASCVFLKVLSTINPLSQQTPGGFVFETFTV
jgi:hypothetical protein